MKVPLPIFNLRATVKRPSGSTDITYSTVGSQIPASMTKVSTAFLSGSTSDVKLTPTIRLLDVGTATITGGILLGDYILIGTTNYEVREVTQWAHSGISGDTLYRVEAAAVYF